METSSSSKQKMHAIKEIHEPLHSAATNGVEEVVFQVGENTPEAYSPGAEGEKRPTFEIGEEDDFDDRSNVDEDDKSNAQILSQEAGVIQQSNRINSFEAQSSTKKGSR